MPAYVSAPIFPIIALGLCAVLCLPAPAAATGGDERCQAALAPALQQLIDWPGEVWRFAVAEHRPTGKFVQFGYDQGLFLDLPTQVLSDSEQRAVKTLFLATGGGGPRRMEATDLEGTQIWVETLHRHFGPDGDAAAAAHLGCRVLVEAFGVPAEAELEILVDGD